MRAVLLDAASLGDDIDLDAIRRVVSTLDVYPATEPDELQSRVASAELIITNKVNIPAEIMAGRKGILVLATGTNNIDMVAAQQLGVPVLNVENYGTDAVAQHTLMLMLALAARLPQYQQDVAQGAWQHSDRFCLQHRPVLGLHDKTLVLVGEGSLGKAVARLALALGMHVQFAARPGKADDPRPSLDALLPQADVLSFHCPLTDTTRHLLNARRLQTIKADCLVINCARGGVIDEVACLQALRDARIGGLGVDVLPEEPPSSGHPLLDAMSENLNLIVTPHNAWITREARQALVDKTAENIQRLVNPDIAI